MQKITILIACLLFCWSGVMAKYALNVSCSNQITAIANGDTGPYYFTWTDPNGNILNPTDNADNKITAVRTGNYSVIITNHYGCETILNVLIGDPSCKLSSTLADANLSIYPNPFSDGLLVNFESETDAAAFLQISDLTGKVFYEQQVSSVSGKNSHQIDLSQDLSKGVYLLSLKIGNQPVETTKLIKE